MVSADDRVIPILGYSDTNTIPEKITNSEVSFWFDNYSKQIKNAVDKNLVNTEILEKWENARNGKFAKDGKAVGPLLTTTWDQDAAYNDYCPTNTYTGCVATAMAQIMNYHEYPVTGVSWHRYNHATYGDLTAYFDDVNYNWNNMPDGSGNNDVALLMYHCGVSVEMDYSTSGSGAQSADVPMALANYFQYDQGMSNVARADYTDPNWILLLKAELDALRPIYYSGSSTASGGHAFVFDGYNTSDQFHINWGWSGYADGYFTIGALNPAGENFNESNDAIIGIQPPTPGNEKFYFVKEFSAFPNVSAYPGQIDAVDEMVAWSIARDGSGGQANYRIFNKTKDGGATWSSGSVTTLGGTAFSMIDGLNKDTAFIAMYGTGATGNKILKTVNGGTSWASVKTAAGSESFFNVVHFFNDNDGLVMGDPQAGYFEIYLTANGGTNWTRVASSAIPTPLAGEYGITGLCTAVGNTFWFTTNKGRVYKSTDKGATWSVVTFYSGTYTTNADIAFDEGALNGIIQTGLSDASSNPMGNKMYSTTNGGTNWTEITSTYTGNFYTSGISSVPGQANTFISVGADFETPLMGASKTIDGGLTWNEIAQYYSAFQMISVDMVSATKGYAGTFCGETTQGMFVFGQPSAELLAGFSSQDAGGIDTLFCINTDITFTNTSSGLISSYAWDFGADATIATGNTAGPFTLQYTAGGVKTITLTIQDSYGNQSVYNQTIIVAEAAPANAPSITGDIHVTINSTHTYTVPQQENTYFTWLLPHTYWHGSSNTNSIDITFTGFATAGDLKVTPFNGCGTASQTSLHIDFATSVKDIDNSVVIYPIPADNMLNISNGANSDIKIYNISGKLMFSGKVETNLFSIDLSSYATGIYTIQMIQNNTVKSRKINIVK